LGSGTDRGRWASEWKDERMAEVSSDGDDADADED
jgi:hypothetical protein